MNSSRTILLIEDDPDDQNLFISALRGIENSPSLELVNNGKEAIEWLYRAALPPRIVFLDIHMPIMNGMFINPGKRSVDEHRSDRHAIR